MILCLDVGNSHIYGGVFLEENIVLRFRHASKHYMCADEIGVFLRTVLKENSCDVNAIKAISICSVVPQLDYALRSACEKYFKIPAFFMNSDSNLGLNIKYLNPTEIGADRLANALAASAFFKDTNIIIIDFGTAITFCALTDKKEYLGGAIAPGIRLSAQALSHNTAKLPSVEIIKMDYAIGKTTINSIQSGLYWGTVGACREILNKFKQEVFQDKQVITLATGGFSSLFEGEGLYSHHMPDLVLHGLRMAIA